MQKIGETEALEPRKEAPAEFIGKRVLHPVFGEGTVIGKPKDEEPNVEQGEIRNDEVIKEKEENAPVEDDEHEDVIIVEDDKVSTGESKDEVVENAPVTEDDGEGNKNGPEYQPPAGGDNPFDNDTETEIEDTPVEDLIGDGEDRPGEGIHF